MRRTPVPSLLVVTVVAVLIWTWAATETRETTTVNLTLQWTTAAKNMIVTPAERLVEVELQGSRIALEDARSLFRSPMLIALPAEAGDHRIELVEALNQHPQIREAHVTVGSVEPSVAEIHIDTIETHSLQVRPPALPGVVSEGPVEVTPQDVTIHVPSSLRHRLPDAVDCEVVDRAQLERLPPGQRVQMNARLRLPEPFASNQNVRVEPAMVTVAFTVRSNIRKITLPTVNVQIGGPWQDHQEYTIEIDEADRVLRDVVVSADGALIDRIIAKDVKVIGWLHLSTQDKERGIISKRITQFIAVEPDGTLAPPITAEVNGEEHPLIHLKITEREAPSVE